MEKLVSIVVPVYNAGTYLGETIEAVQSQTFQQWELLLVDDCSCDNSRELIMRYAEQDTRIRLIARSRNAGAAEARNTGIEEAKGRYLAFLDADDLWLPNKLKRTFEFMEEHRAAFVFTSYAFGDEQARSTGKIVHVPESLTYKRALSRTVIFTSTVMFDREKIPAELIKMPLVKSEDTACWWQILRTGCVARGLDEMLVIYRRPEHSLSSNKLEAIKRIWHLYRQVEHLPLIKSVICFIFWAYRATVRRI